VTKSLAQAHNDAVERSTSLATALAEAIPYIRDRACAHGDPWGYDARRLLERIYAMGVVAKERGS